MSNGARSPPRTTQLEALRAAAWRTARRFSRRAGSCRRRHRCRARSGAAGRWSIDVQSWLLHAEDVAEVVAAEVAHARAREAVEERAGRRVLHRSDQRGGHRPALGTRLPVALHDPPPQRAPVVDRVGDQPVVDAHDVPDAVPGVEVRVGVLVGERRVELAQRVEDDDRERHQRPGEVLLVDRRAPVPGPSAGSTRRGGARRRA